MKVLSMVRDGSVDRQHGDCCHHGVMSLHSMTSCRWLPSHHCLLIAMGASCSSARDSLELRHLGLQMEIKTENDMANRGTENVSRTTAIMSKKIVVYIAFSTRRILQLHLRKMNSYAKH